jgi:hypothetical protein
MTHSVDPKSIIRCRRSAETGPGSNSTQPSLRREDPPSLDSPDRVQAVNATITATTRATNDPASVDDTLGRVGRREFEADRESVRRKEQVTMMAVAALLATASSVNATLYAAGGLTSTLAETGQFPPFFGRGSRLGPHAGLLITAALVLVVSNVVDLSAIASVGSACSLMIFLLVGVSGYRLRAETGARGWIVAVAMAATAVVLVFFAVDTLRNAPETFAAIVAIAALAVVLDAVWKHIRKEPPPSTAGYL